MKKVIFVAVLCMFLLSGMFVKSQDVVAETDKRPVLRVGMQNIKLSLDPAIALANVGFPISYQMFDTLIIRDFGANESGTANFFKPGLAKSWKMIDDHTWEIKLREGVTFHNGDPLTSEDVKFTVDRILDPNSKYVWARMQLSNIERVETPEKLTARIITKRPDAVFVDLFGYIGTAIVPKKYFQEVGFEGFGQKPIGTGPYRLEKLLPLEEVRMKAFDQYWGGKPTASRVIFKVIPEVSARITALANNEVHIINNVPPDQIKAVERLKNCRLMSTPVNCHLINYMTKHPAMKDKKLRQALNLAIDRQLLIDTLWHGKAEILQSHQYPEWDKALYNPDRPKFAYDLEKARQLVKESNYKGEELSFITHPVYYTNGLAAAQAAVEMWSKIGVKVKVRVDENWYAVSLKDPTVAIRNVSDWLILCDPHASIFWSWTVSAAWEGNDAYKKLGVEGQATLDKKKRYAIYQKMLDMFEEEAPGTVLYRVPEFYGVSNKIEWRPYMYMMHFHPGHLKFK